ncbi:Gfo/Idh/MocA family oxidoreductase [Proteiniclasticum sp. BAD-10]|uniref:Gfo/Idh/MocA family oxidoreductase n=1 Tax=Proteiniclasticum sediminis TaxID=2804028 RepID=A0A941CLY7_9CLOT|nr:Gfo/Idh/MocA family oxidoreductase [Proteiniclasticum sediminis]MBR0575101.1 Gfo/Idh/MocA family oxidoreductase [Proteiniclasticum sediminis]
MKPIRVAFIGCGKIAQVRHIPEFAAHDGAEIAGYYNRTPERAKDMAKKYGGAVYSSVEELLADDGVDAVVISVANRLHAAYTLAALSAGKHVLCEKPMALTLKDCRAMVEKAKETGKHLLIGHNQRLTPAHRKARALVEEGAIGKVLSFRTTFGHGGPEGWSIRPGKDTWFFDPENAGMGVMADLGIHKTDLLQYLTGETVTEVTAQLHTLDKTGPEGDLIAVDDNAFCIYRLSGGAVGTLTVSWTFYGPEDNSTILYGTEGMIRIYDDPQVSLRLQKKSGEVVDYPLETIQTNENQTASGVAEAFLQEISSGEPSVLNAEEALSAMAAVFTALESSRQGKTLPIITLGGV